MKGRVFDLQQVVPHDVSGIMQRLVEFGHECWLVGGAVRDLLLGLEPKDWDLAATATTDQLLRLFPRVVPTGVRHGTVQVRTRERGVEVTSCHPPGAGGILEDLGRRDFTLNAMAIAWPCGEILDPHDGEQDLKADRLRAVGDARLRFREDPLRTLRACRFVGVYGFSLEPATFSALKEEADGLRRVARERIREEMFRLILGPHVKDAFGWMWRGGVLRHVLPELTDRCSEPMRPVDSLAVFRRAVRRVYFCPYRLEVRLAALLQDVAEAGKTAPELAAVETPGATTGITAAVGVLERWRSSQARSRHVLTLIENRLPGRTKEWSEADARRILARVGPGLVRDLLDLATADRRARDDPADSIDSVQNLRTMIEDQLDSRAPTRIQDLAIDGADIMRILGIAQGPRVGEILKRILDRVLEEPGRNERDELLELVRAEYDKTF